jgi:hypothetical protein
MKFQVECSQKYTKESFVLQGHFGVAVRFEHKVIVSESQRDESNYEPF